MIDRTDLQILKHLKENARINASVIGERISMSVSAVIERIRKLESAGVIRQYTVVLDPQKIGKDICAFISVSLEHPKFNDGFIASVRSESQIIECHYITGDFDFLLKVMTGSTEGLTDVLNSIKCIKGVSLTRTLIVLSTTKNEYTVLPDAETKRI
jgi:Lrp/AsnC family leucine-responsive transcriptional regulator